MKNMTKRIILSVVTLVLVVVALGTTTFAWFTLSETATVSDITGTVQAGEGLEIGLSGAAGTLVAGPTTGYRTNLTSTDWDQIYGTGKAIDPATFSFGALSLNATGTAFSTYEEGTMTGNPVPNTSVLASTTTINARNTAQSFLEFKVHFRSNSAGKVNWSGYNFNDGTTVAFNPGVIFTDASGTLTNDPNAILNINAANAARIGIYNATGTTLTKAVQKPATQDANLYTNTVNAGGNAIVGGQFSYLTAKGYVIKVNETTVLTDTTVLTQAFYDAAVSVDGNSDTVATLASTSNGYEAVITVKVWLEGWDADMYDALFNSTLSFNLEFKKA